MMKKQIILLIFLGFLFSYGSAQSRKKTTTSKNPDQSSFVDLFSGLTYRSIGPFRGGRSAAVTGVPGNPLLFYFGGTGGGVWKTIDGGQSWQNISDGYFGGSIGAVAVSSSDPNVIYVGGGEKTVRGNVSFGYGVFKSVDAGKTWSPRGLEMSMHIPRIRIHPNNPDIVYAAVLGDLYQSTNERGVYKSTNGGETWRRVLFANSDAGAVDLVVDPRNHRILYASTWRVRRSPYDLSSGGEGSILWKSTDEGETWKPISANPGFATGTLGIIGIAVSPQNSNKLYAIVEAENGGLYRSADGGDTWKRVNDDRNLRQRAWYYSRIYADPVEENTVYVLNVRYHKSTNGGETFTSYNAPHGDHHDLWIAPEDPKRIIIGDDGGAQVSFDGGENWSSLMNQPTGQFYRVVTDNHFPFRIYGAQQDNSTVRIYHRTDGYSIGEQDWEETAGGESAHLAIDPTDNDVVYGGSYGGYLVRVNHRTGQQQAIDVWPDNPMGHGAEGMKYRFQWNFPIFFSPHNPEKLYAASNHLHVSYNQGQSWEVISPDLTRNEPSMLVTSGGPITKDNTGVEYYCTIFAACESPYEKGLIWTGSDDGLIHMTQDGGQSWKNVTPSGLPEWMMINSIDPDPFLKGCVYVAGTRYKSGDYQPYLYRTSDYGKSWDKITEGIPSDQFTRVVRADPVRKGLLYAGTEKGMFISFNYGNSWEPFQLNLPVVPVTDLTIKENILIVATQGRSFWTLDDLTLLHQLDSDIDKENFFLFKPDDAWRFGSVVGDRKSTMSGQNHPGGVQIFYYMPKLVDSLLVEIEIREQNGDLVRTFSTRPKEGEEKLKIASGVNRFTWDLQYRDAEGFDGLIMWAGSLRGPKAIPGEYQIDLKVDDLLFSQTFRIKMDPRSETTHADMVTQFNFLLEVRDKLSETHKAIKEIRKVKGDISYWLAKAEGSTWMDSISSEARRLKDAMERVEKSLYQTKNQSGQDPLNFPIQLNNKLAYLSSIASMGDFPPTQQAVELKIELIELIDKQLGEWRRIQKELLPAFNGLVKESGIQPVGRDLK